MRRVLIFMVLGLMSLSGCADIPNFDTTKFTPSGFAGFRILIPIEPLLQSAAFDALSTEAQTTLLVGQVARLRARAAALRRPVIDQRTRRILAAALRRHLR